MNVQNTIALLEIFRGRNVSAVRTPAGVIFMGVANLSPEEKKRLLSIPQMELEAALRWQQ